MAPTAGGLIVSFVPGVVAADGSATNRPRRVRRKPDLVAPPLALGATAASLGQDRAAMTLAAMVLDAASDVFRKIGAASISVTFINGTLVRIGQGLAEALRGSSRSG